MSPIKGGDIPGFYRDPKTGKYYRDNPNDAATSGILKNIKQSAVGDQTGKNKKPKPIRNVLTFLRDRELNGVGGSSALATYYGIRTANKSLKLKFDLNGTERVDPNISSVEFLKCGPSAIYGMWNMKTVDQQEYSYAVAQIPIEGAANPTNILSHLTNDFVIDMCEDFSNTLVYVANDPKTGHGKVQLVWKRPEDLETTVFDLYESKNKTLFSCAHTHFSNEVSHIAIGESNSVTEYDGLAKTFSIDVSGNVHALAYSENSSHLLFGTSKGMVGIYDIRMEYEEETPPAVEIKYSDRAVIDAYFLSDHQAILASLDNELKTFDIRNKCNVTSFLGHHTSVKKLPISVANNMVCINGSDNKVRIWTLSGGLPIHVIEPSDPETKIRGCISGNHKSYLYCFEGYTESIYEL